jgi:diguanylate cyclase (GGDEF)-like protein
MDLQDRTVFGYLALPRGFARFDMAAFVREALTSVQYTSPALLFVPLSSALIQDEGFDPFTTADQVGATPGEVAWLIPESTALEIPGLVSKRISQLRARGFRAALADVTPGMLGRRPIADLLPDFVLLSDSYTGHVFASLQARAELAGLLAYCARLDSHVVVCGIIDGTTARSLIGLGVRLGVGHHLGTPKVLDADHARPGDEVVPASWFRQQGVRVLQATGDTLDDAPVVTPLPENDGEPLDAQGFAWSLAQAARKMQAEHDPRRILAITGEHLPESVRADRIAIFEADWDRYVMKTRLVAGRSLEGLDEMEIPLDRGVTGWAFLRGYPYNCPDTRSHSESLSIPGQDESTLEESLLVVPLIAGDHRLGAIDIWRDGTEQFAQEDLERAALFGYITAAAWLNAQLYAELELRAMTDTLTGLLNHRWWDELAAREAARSSRAGTEIGILLLDLDHFKRVNDQWGHAAGDELLRNVGRAIQATLRAGDAAVRYGGEEFLIMLHDTTDVGAMRVAEAVRDVLGKLRTPGPSYERVTVSTGIAFLPRHGTTLAQVANAADAAMYKAKAQGRDCIVLAAHPGGEQDPI